MEVRDLLATCFAWPNQSLTFSGLALRWNRVAPHFNAFLGSCLLPFRSLWSRRALWLVLNSNHPLRTRRALWLVLNLQPPFPRSLIRAAAGNCAPPSARSRRDAETGPRSLWHLAHLPRASPNPPADGSKSSSLIVSHTAASPPRRDTHRNASAIASSPCRR